MAERVCLLIAMVLLASQADAEDVVDCRIRPTHGMQLTIDTSGIKTKGDDGRDLDLWRLRNRLTRKLQVAGIQVLDEQSPDQNRDFPATHVGKMSLELIGDAYEAAYRQITGGQQGEIRNFFSGVDLRVTIAITYRDATRTETFETRGTDWSSPELLPTSAAAAPFDCAVLESESILKFLYQRLSVIVGPTNASRALIEGYAGYDGYMSDSTLKAVHAALKESRSDGFRWLLQELEEPCDSNRRRAAAILPLDRYEQLFGSEPPSVAARVVDACRVRADGGGLREIIPDLMVVLTTSEDEQARAAAASRLIRIAHIRSQKGDKEAVRDLRAARDQAPSKERERIEAALNELDPFYLRPPFVLGVIAALVVIGAISFLATNWSSQRR